MKIITSLIICLLLFYHKSDAQKEIIYSVENAVVDSLQNGINMYAKVFNKDTKDLKLFAIIAGSNNEFEIYLQQYSQLPESGFKTLIETSNRKLLVRDIKIPVIFTTDILSSEAKKDKIDDIPLSGYYIRIVKENYKQKVVHVAFLF